MLITTLSDGTTIEQDRGSFDDYCVYVTRPGSSKYAPKDTDYFTFFITQTQSHSPQEIYDDFVAIYDQTTAMLDDKVINNTIPNLCPKYGANKDDFILWFTVIYLGMVAEENKRNAILKKRIKRLGMYQILLEGFTATDAANFSKGKKVAELDPLCTSKGF